MPVECQHGKILDWGSFGPTDDAEPEFCLPCSPLAFIANRELDTLRNIVWEHFIGRARADEKLQKDIETIGVFKFMDVVDAVIDTIHTAAEQDPSLEAKKA